MEIEDDDHVFTKLNFAPEHPARDMQDTFYISRLSEEESNPGDILLRTYIIRTSSGNAHAKPPIRTISPGRVFRNEAISARVIVYFIKLKDYTLTNVSLRISDKLYYSLPVKCSENKQK